MRVFLSFLFLVTLTACMGANDLPLEGKPAHHTQGGFKNLYVKDPHKNLFDFLKMKHFGPYDWADHKALAHTVKTQPVDVSKLHTPPEELQVTWLGHSTFLIQKDGLNILTDPVFGDRAFGVSFMGPERYSPHVMEYSDLPRIDFVIISHNHYDHLDHVATRQLGNQPTYLVPLKLKDWFVGQGVDQSRIQEFDWWDKASFDGLEVEALPSQHWSARSIWDRRKTLWASWSLTIGNSKIWFAGDTGYNEHLFKEIGKKAGPFDLGLIPIGAYEPRDFMKTYHVNAEEAVLVHKDVQARRSIGMHWGTFPLTAEAPNAPVTELRKQKKNQIIADNEFVVMVMGQTLRIP